MKNRSPEDQALILIVDDDPTIRLIAQEVLELKGFRTEAAADGEEALAVIPSLRPDLILLDVSMPGTGGLAVCRNLRRSGSRIPVLMMTGFTDPDTIQGIHDVGATDYIGKPPRWIELVDRLRCILQSDQKA